MQWNSIGGSPSKNTNPCSFSSLWLNANSDRYRSGFRGITLSASSALNLCRDLLSAHEHNYSFKSVSCSYTFSQDYRLYWLALRCNHVYCSVHCVCLGLDFNSRWRCKTITLLSLMIIVSGAAAPKEASLPFPDLVSLPEKEQQISDQIPINCMNCFIHIFACCITSKATVSTILRHLQTINLRRHGGLLSLRACMKLKKFNGRHLCWSLVCSPTWQLFHAHLTSYHCMESQLSNSTLPKATCLSFMHTHIAHHLQNWRSITYFHLLTHTMLRYTLYNAGKIIAKSNCIDGQLMTVTSKRTRAGIVHGTQILLYRLGTLLLYILSKAFLKTWWWSKPCQQVWNRKIAKKSPNLDVSSDSCDRVHKEAAVKFARREVAGIGGMSYFRKPIWTLWKGIWHLRRCVWW